MDMEALVQRIEFSAAGLQKTQSEVTKAMQQIGGASDDASRRAGAMGSAVSASLRGIGSVASTVTRDAFNVAGAFTTTVATTTAALAGIGIKTNSELETATLQFETLLGSADAAKERVASLFEFAKATPFETGPIIKASRLMQTFGGDALATEANLRLVGDAAAGTSQGIDEIAFWVGRAYAAMQGGQPFGEARMRLQELAILTPEAAAKLTELSDSGASADEMFTVLQDSLGRFGGAMEKQATTFDGLKSTLSDVVQLGAAQAFKPLFDSVKEVMQAMIDFASSDSFDTILNSIAILVNGGAKYLSQLADAIGSLSSMFSPKDIEGFFRTITGGAEGAIEGLGNLGPIVAAVGGAFLSMKAGAIPVLGAFVPAISPITAGLGALLLSTDAGRDAMGKLGTTLKEVGRTAIPPIIDGLQVVAEEAGTALAQVLSDLTPVLAEIANELGPALGDALKELGPPLGDVVIAFGELVSSVLPPLAGLVTGLIGPISSLVSGGLDLLADLLGLAADNADILIPAIAGLAGVIQTIKLMSFIEGLGGLAGALGTAKDKVADFALQAVGLKDAAKGMGDAAGNAAGPGGLGAIAGASTGAILGMVGVGIAIAAVTAYMQYQARAAADAKAAQEAYLTAIDETGSTLAGAERGLRQWLEGVTAANHEMDNTNEVADVSAAFDAMGTSVEGAADKITGSASEYRAFRGELEGTLADIYAQRDGYKSLADAQEQTGVPMDLYTNRAKDTANALDKQRTALLGAEEAHEAQERALYNEVTAAEAATDKTNQLRQAYDLLIGNTVDVEKANLNMQQAILGVTSAIEAANGQINAQTEEGLRARQAFASGADSVRAYADSLIAAGKPLDEVAFATQAYRQSLVDQAVAAGASREEVEAYLAQLGLTPDQVTTYIEAANAAEAEAKAKSFRDRVNEIPPEKRSEFLANVDQGRLDVAERQLNDAARDRVARIRPSVEIPGGGLDGALFNAALAGRRAKGGPTKAGQTYLVGEEGPELWTSPADGMVIPADKTRRFLEAGPTRSAPVVAAAAASGGSSAPLIGHADIHSDVDLELLLRRGERSVRTASI